MKKIWPKNISFEKSEYKYSKYSQFYADFKNAEKKLLIKVTGKKVSKFGVSTLLYYKFAEVFSQ